jgi:PKD repeat protein
MKKISLLLSLFFMTSMLVAQNQISILGNLSNVNSPVPITISFVDSLSGGATITILTDAQGNIQGSLTYNPIGFGYFEVSFLDCQGQLILLHYPYPAPSQTIVITEDYCPQTSPCDASFFYSGWQEVGDPMLFDAQTTTASSYSWDMGNGTVLTGGPQVSYTYTSPGIYNVCLTVIGGGCVDTYCSALNIQLATPCNADFMTRPDSLDPFSYQFINTSPAPGHGSFWEVDGVVLTASNPSVLNYIFNTVGTYEVCLTVYDTLAPCNSTYCETIFVDTSAISCQAAFLITPSPTGAPTCYDFLNLSVPSTLFPSFFWDFGDGNTSTQDNPSHCYAGPGQYLVSLTITENGCSNTDYQIVQVGGPQCSAFFFPHISSIMNPFELNLINASAGSTPTSPLLYFWDFGDGSTSTDAFPTHVYANTGIYNICLTIADVATGCTSTFCDSLGMDSLGNIWMRGVTGFTLNVIAPITGTSSTASQAAELLAFPNPLSADGLLNLQLKAFGNEDLTIQVINTAGVSCFREIVQGNADGFTHQLNLNTLPAGMYIIQASTGKQIAQTRFFIP